MRFDPPPSASPETLAKMNEVRSGDDTENGDSAVSPGRSAFAGRHDPTAEVLTGGSGKKIGYIAVSACAGDEGDTDLCAARLRLLVIKVAKANPDGWIIDLRGDGGGDQWRPLVALGPLLEGGTVGYFKTAKGGQPWIYTDNAVRRNTLTAYLQAAIWYLQ
jgi:hypothetical protein